VALVVATQFAAEIAAVSDDGDGLLRERLSRLGQGERRRLRAALDELEAEAEVQVAPAEQAGRRTFRPRICTS